MIWWAKWNVGEVVDAFAITNLDILVITEINKKVYKTDMNRMRKI